MRNWKEKGLNQKPINLTMKELRDTNIRQSYIDRLESKRNYEQAQAELEDAKIDYYTAEPPVAPKPKTKSPYAFRSTQAPTWSQQDQKRKRNNNGMATQNHHSSHRQTTCHRPHLLPRLWRVRKA